MPARPRARAAGSSSGGPQPGSDRGTGPDGSSDRRPRGSESSLGPAQEGNSEVGGLLESRLGLIQLATRGSRNQEPSRANPADGRSQEPLDLSRLPDLSRLGIDDARAHQSPDGAGSRPAFRASGRPSRTTTTRSVSRASVSILPVQLQEIITDDRVSDGQRPDPTAQTVHARPRTFAELSKVNPQNPWAQLIISTMGRIAECHRMHLQIAVKLDQMDPSLRPGFENVMGALERTIRSDQDHIRQWERKAGLFESPRVL